jgi:uncharacterized protein YeaO (DUF488 family)
MIKVKSIFSMPSDDDGYRILVEPVWPRHAGHRRAGVNAWLRYLAPSPGLYELHASNSILWEGFVARYHGELEQYRDYFGDLLAHHHNGGLTLLHGSRNKDHNIAAALKMLLEREENENLQKRDQDTAGEPFGTRSTLQIVSQKVQ